jgi:hypothetical protein
VLVFGKDLYIWTTETILSERHGIISYLIQKEVSDHCPVEPIAVNRLFFLRSLILAEGTLMPIDFSRHWNARNGMDLAKISGKINERGGPSYDKNLPQ